MFDSVFNNGVRILSPMFSKTGTTFASYTITDIAKCKVVPLDTKVFLKSYTKGTLSYLFAVAEYGQVLYSAFCNDPIARANQRGYTLK